MKDVLIENTCIVSFFKIFFFSQEDQNALEEKHSLIKNELIAMRESLEKSHLDGELMKQEKYELAVALEQVLLMYFSC